MDAKSKAKFINSVAGGQKIPCPVCNSLNDSDALFCFSCGNRLKVPDHAPSDASGAGTVRCPACNEANEAGSLFCAACGAKLTKENEAVSTQAFKPVEQVSDRPVERPASAPVKQAFKAAAPAAPAAAEEPEEVSVFAQGLPSWDIVPPQVMVRRKKRK